MESKWPQICSIENSLKPYSVRFLTLFYPQRELNRSTHYAVNALFSVLTRRKVKSVVAKFVTYLE